MIIRYTDTAVDEILSYISRDNPLAAAQVAAAIEHAVASISQQPESAPNNLNLWMT